MGGGAWQTAGGTWGEKASRSDLQKNSQRIVLVPTNFTSFFHNFVWKFWSVEYLSIWVNLTDLSLLMKWFCDWNTKEFDDYYCVFLDILVRIVRAGTISAKMQGIGNPVSWVHLPTVRSGWMGTQVGKNRLRWIEVGNGKSRWANMKDGILPRKPEWS